MISDNRLEEDTQHSWTSRRAKLRTGTYFPDWLPERRKRAEAALTSVFATCYLLGVSTRRMEKLVESLGIIRLSKSQSPFDCGDSTEGAPATPILSTCP